MAPSLVFFTVWLATVAGFSVEELANDPPSLRTRHVIAGPPSPPVPIYYTGACSSFDLVLKFGVGDVETTPLGRKGTLPFFEPVENGTQAALLSFHNVDNQDGDDCVIHSIWSFGEPNEEGFYDTQLQEQATCKGAENVFVGGAGEFAGASGYLALLPESPVPNRVGFRITLCDLACDTCSAV